MGVARLKYVYTLCLAALVFLFFFSSFTADPGYHLSVPHCHFRYIRAFTHSRPDYSTAISHSFPPNEFTISPIPDLSSNPLQQPTCVTHLLWC
jgi:hypothetical protein